MNWTQSTTTRLVLVCAAIALGAAQLPAAAAQRDAAPKADFVRGAKLWASNCTRCHIVRDPKDLRDDQWIASMYHMRLRAGLTGQDTRDILRFLQESN